MRELFPLQIPLYLGVHIDLNMRIFISRCIPRKFQLGKRIISWNDVGRIPLTRNRARGPLKDKRGVSRRRITGRRRHNSLTYTRRKKKLDIGSMILPVKSRKGFVGVGEGETSWVATSFALCEERGVVKGILDDGREGDSREE